MSSNWRELKPWRTTDGVEHLRHDLANMLLPLRMGAETLEQVSSGEQFHLALDLLNSGIERAMDTLDQLTALTEPINLKVVSAASVAQAVGVAGMSRGSQMIQADLSRLRLARKAMVEVDTARQTARSLEVTFKAHQPFAAAAGADEPARPYTVKGAGLALTLAAAVVDGHGGRVHVDALTGACRWQIPHL